MLENLSPKVKPEQAPCTEAHSANGRGSPLIKVEILLCEPDVKSSTLEVLRAGFHEGRAARNPDPDLAHAPEYFHELQLHRLRHVTSSRLIPQCTSSVTCRTSRACIHTHTHTQIHAYMHACIHAYMNAHSYCQPARHPDRPMDKQIDRLARKRASYLSR